MFKTYKTLILGCVTFVLFKSVQSGTTLEQYKEGGRMMRSICSPKFQISPEIWAQLEEKQTPDDRNVKCFINCIFETSKAMKRGKYQLDIALKQVDMMVPDHMKDDYKNGFSACKDAGKGFKDYCDISYEVYKCILAEIPSFIVP
ncbi:general odorant-binding protein 72 [Condylostylus longicornis]|uniref:general odorant-binding protein 72 n=1 Tax=Condylostylus longicornis TaxID=2530218 RepID=UPI00244E2756|nr:general odorant-binding protein 72 [Condylostylus longicornis]